MSQDSKAGLKVIFAAAVGIPALFAMTEVIIPALLTAGCKAVSINGGEGCGTGGLFTGNHRGLLAPLDRSDAWSAVPRSIR